MKVRYVLENKATKQKITVFSWQWGAIAELLRDLNAAYSYPKWVRVFEGGEEYGCRE